MPNFPHTDGLQCLFIALYITCVLCNSQWNSKHRSESSVSCCIRNSSVLTHTLAQPEKYFRSGDESFVSFILIFCHDFSHHVWAGEVGCFRNMSLFSGAVSLNGTLIACKRTRNISSTYLFVTLQVSWAGGSEQMMGSEILWIWNVMFMTINSHHCISFSQCNMPVWRTHVWHQVFKIGLS